MRALDRLWLAPAPPDRLAALRIVTGLYALVYAAVRIVHLADYGKLDPAQFQPVGVVSVLSAPLPPTATWALALATLAAGAAFVAGWRFRLTGPAFAALFLWVTSYRSSWGMIFHTDNLAALHLIVLSLSPAADALAAGAPADGEPSAAHGWPVRLMCAVTVLAYLVSGIAKLRATGLAWVTTDCLRNYVAHDALRKIELGSLSSPLAAWLAGYPGLFQGLAAFTLVIELGAPLALVSGRIARWWVAAIVAFHLGVLAVMAILFPYTTFGLGFASFFAVEKAARWIRGRARGGTSLVLP